MSYFLPLYMSLFNLFIDSQSKNILFGFNKCETWSLKQADYYFDLLMNEIEYLSANPNSGRDYNKIRKGYFRSRVKSHFIFYKINLKDEGIEIIRILHQQMDISASLDE